MIVWVFETVYDTATTYPYIFLKGNLKLSDVWDTAECPSTDTYAIEREYAMRVAIGAPDLKRKKVESMARWSVRESQAREGADGVH
jgi:hypothetical protein